MRHKYFLVGSLFKIRKSLERSAKRLRPDACYSDNDLDLSSTLNSDTCLKCNQNFGIFWVIMGKYSICMRV